MSRENKPVARVIFTRRKKPDVEWLVDEVVRGTLLYAHPAPSDAITPATLAAAIGCKAATILSALQPADVTLNQPLTAEQVAALLAVMAEGAKR